MNFLCDANEQTEAVPPQWAGPGAACDSYSMHNTLALSKRIKVMSSTQNASLCNPNYVKEIQRDGMRVSWRRKVAEWLLEVCSLLASLPPREAPHISPSSDPPPFVPFRLREPPPPVFRTRGCVPSWRTKPKPFTAL